MKYLLSVMSLNRSRPILIVVIAMLCPVRLLAQEPAYRHYTLDDGLPSMQVYRMLQDHKGYMWFATDKGVARFDGKTFKTYSAEEGLKENTIFLLKQDPLKRLWFMHFNKSLYFLEGDTVKPYAFNNKIAEITGNRTMFLVDFEIDEKGDAWLGFSGPPYLARIDSSGGITIESRQDYEGYCGILNLIDSSRLVLSSNFAAAKDMRIIINDLQSQTVLTSEVIPGRVDLPNIRVARTNERIWTLLGNTVFSFDGDAIRVEKQLNKGANGLLVTGKDEFWLSEKGEGWALYKGDDKTTAVQTFFNYSNILEVAEDREGGMWFGTMDDGVYYCPEISTYCLSGTSGIRRSGVSAVTGWKNRIYIGQTSGLLSSFNADFLGEVRSEGRSDYLNGMTPINEDHLLASTVHTLSGASKGVISRFVLDFCKARDTLWVSGVGFVSAFPCVSAEVKERRIFEHRIRMEAIYTEAPGVFLLGTLRGLCKMEHGKMTYLADSFPELAHRISDIERISSKYLAIATRGGGVVLWDGEDVRQVNEETGLSDNNCNVMVLDEHKVPWVGTNKGLDRLVFDTLEGAINRIEHFGQRHGLASADVNYLYLDEDYVWVAGSNGLSRLDKSIDYLTDTAVPPVHILSAQLSGKDIQRNEVVTYENNQFEVSYVGVTFKEPSLTYYKYRLLGGDDKWYQTHSNRLTFAGMSPGEYQFEVVAVKSNGANSGKPAVFEFTISAPFWQRGFFWPTVLGLFLLAMALIVYRYINRIKQKNALFREMSRLRESALRNQMNPHFVYNAMNSIQSLILRDDKEKAMSYLTKFAGLLRFSFNTSGKELIPFKEDLEALELYIDLEQMRYPGNLKVKYSVSALVNDTLVPPLLIQPFVENAVKHGILKSGKEGTVIIGVNIVDEKRLKVHIQDNGNGFEREFIAQKQLSPSGMKVTLDRLNQFNAQNNVTTEFRVESPVSGEGKGARIEFVLARKKDADD